MIVLKQNLAYELSQYNNPQVEGKISPPSANLLTCDCHHIYYLVKSMDIIIMND